jgi:hypothetical protein
VCVGRGRGPEGEFGHELGVAGVEGWEDGGGEEGREGWVLLPFREGVVVSGVVFVFEDVDCRGRSAIAGQYGGRGRCAPKLSTSPIRVCRGAVSRGGTRI